jgi:hypothetical protein
MALISNEILDALICFEIGDSEDMASALDAVVAFYRQWAQFAEANPDAAVSEGGNLPPKKAGELQPDRIIVGGKVIEGRVTLTHISPEGRRILEAADAYEPCAHEIVDRINSHCLHCGEVFAGGEWRFVMDGFIFRADGVEL